MAAQDRKLEIGSKIRRFRKAKGMTIAQVAEKLDPQRSKNTVQSWEVGRTEPDAGTMLQLCRVLDVDISAFFKEDDVQTYLINVIDDSEPIRVEEDLLTYEEQELVSYYREMNETGKKALLASAYGLFQSFSDPDE